MMIKLLGSLLTGKANTFYMRYIALKQEKWMVDKLITALFDYCFPNNTMELLRRKWDETVQGKKRVLEYARELENLAQKFKEMNKRQVVLKFWKGLNRNLRGDRVMQRVNPERDDLDTAVNEAIQCEKAHDERASILRNEKEPRSEASGSRKPKREWTRFKNRNGGTTHYKPGEASQTGNKPNKIRANVVSQTNQGSPRDKPQQGYKNNRQYTKDDKKLSRKQMDTLRAEGKCFNCREAGHEQRNCLKLQSMKPPKTAIKAGAIGFASLEKLVEMSEESDVWVGSMSIIRNDPIAEELAELEEIEFKAHRLCEEAWGEDPLWYQEET